MSRTKNTMRNIKWGLLNKLVLMLFPFIMRTLLIKKMGSEFVGITALFASVLQVLNLAELGIGAAITFSLYKPLAENNVEIVRATMKLYKKLYRILGSVILLAGLSLMPFLNNFINGDIPPNINIYILYGIYLINTVLSYFLFAYKTTLLVANQRNDIVNNVNTVLYIVQFIYQAFAIITFKNYYMYVYIIPIITIMNNIFCALYAKKMYPQYYSSGELPKENKEEIKKSVYGLAIQRICETTRNSLDSIFISSFLGLSTVAIYNNYYMILHTISGILSVLTGAMVSSVGNSMAVESIDKNYNDMNKFNFIFMWLSGWCTICLLFLYQPFMELWLGKSYLLNFFSVLLFCFYFYALRLGSVRSVYFQGIGLWWKGKYRALIEAFLNVILNYILGKLWGLNGIIAGTLISLLLVNFGYGSTIIFKYYFKNKNVSDYFRNHLLYFIVTTIVAIITYIFIYIITNAVHLNAWLSFIVIGIICIVIPNVSYYLIYRKYYLFHESIEFINEIIKNRKMKEE